MIRLLISQLWNQRRANTWVFAGLFPVCVLLWYAIDLIYNFEGAALRPKGYDTSCVFDLQVETKPIEMLADEDNRRAGEDFTYLYNLIKDYPGVEEAAWHYGSVPYTDEVMFEGYCAHTDSLHTVGCKIRYVSPSYFRVFRLRPVAGTLDEARWRAAEHPMPALMSAGLADSLFHTAGADAAALGRTCFNPYWLNSASPVTNYRVMAVLPPHKLDDYRRYEPFIYLPAPGERPLFWQHVAIRVHPDYVAGFAERFLRDMQQPFDRGIFYLHHIRSYADMKRAYDIAQGTVNYLNATYSVVAFFVFNLFLSILGTFWFRTRKRRAEIALRMALGCPRGGILRHYLAEGMLLLLAAALPAFVVCLNMQVADLTVHTLVDATWPRFFGCFFGAVALMAAVVMAGIWFPARSAMRIRPAVALHDE